MPFTLTQIIMLVLLAIVVILIAVYYRSFVGAFVRLRKFWREVAMEMKKVAWPSRDEVVSSTAMVGVTVLIMVVIIGTADSILGKLVGLIFHF